MVVPSVARRSADYLQQTLDRVVSALKPMALLGTIASFTEEAQEDSKRDGYVTLTIRSLGDRVLVNG